MLLYITDVVYRSRLAGHRFRKGSMLFVDIQVLEADSKSPGPRGYKAFFVLNSAKHKICLANKSQITKNCNSFLRSLAELLLAFSYLLAEKFSCSAELSMEKCFITSGPADQISRSKLGGGGGGRGGVT